MVLAALAVWWLHEAPRGPLPDAVSTRRGHPTGFDFFPHGAADCNLNLVSDACDIASDASEGADGDGVPDERQADCLADHDGNGAVNTRDFIVYLNDRANLRPRADLNDDFEIDIQDWTVFLNAWAAGCSR